MHVTIMTIRNCYYGDVTLKMMHEQNKNICAYKPRGICTRYVEEVAMEVAELRVAAKKVNVCSDLEPVVEEAED